MPDKRSMLFSLQKKGSDIRHFLFGTMHTRNEGAYVHARKAVKYLQQVDKYYAEMDLTDMDSTPMTAHFMLPANTTLSSLYKERHFARMRKIFLKSFDLDIVRFSGFLPFYIQTILGELVLTAERSLPLDYYLWEEARKSGKVLGGVESMQRQVDILHQIPVKTQARSLKLLSENPAKFRHTIHKLNIAYEKADLISLYKITRKQLGSLRNLMLTERNIRMADFIMDNTNEDASFFAVGAAHLAGKTGVVNRLKNAGFVIKPVKA